MTKTRLVSALAALSLVAAPSVALAHRDGGDHHKRHAKKHHVKKAKERQVVNTPASSTTPSTTTPAPAITATVTKFENGELTITLSNGKAFTADVTKRTHIKCVAAAVPTARTAGKDDDKGDHDGGKGRGHDDEDDDHGDKDHGDGDHNDDGHPDNGQVKCGASALTAGTQVIKARLVIRESGASWKKLVLVK
jgi:hypothetical protein